MASLLVKSLADRVIKNASPSAFFAEKLGEEGEYRYSSSNMLMVGEPDQQEMSATFRICEGSEDDDGDIVEPEGCVLDRFRKNPCVLFHHDKAKPAIGMSEDKSRVLHLTIRPNEIIAKCFFHGLPFDNKNWSREIFNLVCAGALRGASVGFLPIEAKKRGYGKDEGYHFTKYLLSEWSITPLPSNSDTLRMCLSRGYVKSLSLKTRLEGMLPPAQQWAHGASLPPGDRTMARKLGVANIEFDREIYKSAKDCVGFLKARGYDCSVASELPSLFVYQQSDAKPGAGQKSLAKGVTANLYVKKAKADDEEEEDDKPEDETAPAVEDEVVEKDDDGDADDVPAETDEAVETTAEDAETEPDVDHSQKPGAQDLRDLVLHFAALTESIPQMLSRNENPKVVKILEKLSADAQKVDADLREAFGAQYPGANLDEMLSQDVAPVEETPPVEDVVDEPELDETVTKAEDEKDAKEFMKALKLTNRKLDGVAKKLSGTAVSA